MTVHKNEVYYADLSPIIGSEQGGTRPVLAYKNDTEQGISYDHHRFHHQSTEEKCDYQHTFQSS